jgi:hypothetical protein
LVYYLPWQESHCPRQVRRQQRSACRHLTAARYFHQQTLRYLRPVLQRRHSESRRPPLARYLSPVAPRCFRLKPHLFRYSARQPHRSHCSTLLLRRSRYSTKTLCRSRCWKVAA